MIRYFKYLDAILFSIAGFCIVYLFTKYSGVGVSPDSIMYTSAARSLHSSGSLITFNNTAITDFPVFYPVFLWFVLAITGVDPIAAGPVINGVLFAALLLLSGRIIQQFKPGSWLYKWCILVAILLSPALLQVYTYLWSETLFMVITLVFLMVCREYFLKHTLSSLLIVGLVAALSSITRYAGITLIGTGGLLLLMDRSLPLKRKIGHILIYGVAASSLLVFNLVRNALATGRLTGPREVSVTPFMKNVYYFGTVMIDWAGGTDKLYTYAVPLTILLFVFLTAVLLYGYLKKNISSYENLAVAFTFVYGAFIIVSSTFSRYERINSRLLSPLFVTLLLSCTFWVIGLIKKINNRGKYIALPIAILLIAGFCYQELTTDLQRYDDENDYGVPGYTDDSWNKSAFAAYLKKDNSLFKPGVPVYSDANEALYFLSGAKVKLLPHRYFKNTIEQFYQVKHYYLVWFNAMDNPELISLNDVVKVEKLKVLKQFPEGTIYEYVGE
ncbi:MAG: hypothetical protein ACXVAY_19385 [Mucilaginibacter sp.]